ncbi:MAG TPA: hypothetical protein VE690_03585, partial [Rhodopila sp.]|nr:hypothetical protein [Rhodopila sp.]
EWINTSPNIGDIVAFTPTPTLSPSTAARLRVQRTDRQACVLDLATLHSLGGSLLVESRLGGRFVVHWAGPHTSTDTADCGSAADLMLDRAQIEMLNAAARDYIPGLRPVWLPGQGSVSQDGV